MNKIKHNIQILINLETIISIEHIRKGKTGVAYRSFHSKAEWWSHLRLPDFSFLFPV